MAAPEQLALSATDQQTIGNFCVLAARLATNGVYMGQVHSKSLGAPVLVIAAIGDQALALQDIVMKHAVGDAAGLVEHVTEHHKGF